MEEHKRKMEIKAEKEREKDINDMERKVVEYATHQKRRELKMKQRLEQEK